ncbi:MAG TPA: hydantoinase/oxoprolinase family protein, partial [Acidimicrobiales bacterium]|nr:hydantoinase/oxoprolinase family protein [Acidimicrobiales bacterium]
MTRFRLGIDVGGTFTDATLVDEQTGAIRIGKVLSTPDDPSIGFLRAVERMTAHPDVTPRSVALVVHATTVATNAIIEGNMARTAFVTTEGFRDLLEIARQIRPALYDPNFSKPPPLVPRELCFGVPERIDASGKVVVPLDEAAVRRVAELLRDLGVEAVAVCFLHAYLDAAHEQRAAAIIGEVHPGAVVSLSSDVVPEIREYLRASTTIINAGVRPLVSRYLGKIRDDLDRAGVRAELLVMQSGGGVYSSSMAQERPVAMVESGPAAGVMSASFFGELQGSSDVLSFDMGGTTAKAGIVLKGVPRVTKDYEVGSAAMPGAGSQRGSGYPIRTPVIELVEIGAGGGSIAWVDRGGSLRVGPRSAGADPGPACYGRGGTEPTVSDANLVLRRLDPDHFLGGEMTLDLERAHRAIEERCARPLAVDVLTAAHGIVEIANAAMVNALKLVSVQRGLDPRGFLLVAFGGAGPLHANRIADELGIERTLIPISPGIASSLGLLVTDIKREHAAALFQQAARVEVEALAAQVEAIEARAAGELRDAGVAEADLALARLIDARYVGQSYELSIPLAPGRLGPQ